MTENVLRYVGANHHIAIGKGWAEILMRGGVACGKSQSRSTHPTLRGDEETKRCKHPAKIAPAVAHFHARCCARSQFARLYRMLGPCWPPSVRRWASADAEIHYTSTITEVSYTKYLTFPEYLAVLDDAAFGAATDVVPKFVSPADPAARWTGAHGGQAFFAYSTNYMIDVDHGIIVDVEATTAIRQAEVLAAKRMIARSMDRFDLYP